MKIKSKFTKTIVKQAQLGLGLVAGVILSTVFSQSIYAHGRYVKPSHTVLSGDKAQSITLTSSISNDIFHPDRALGDNGKGVKHPSLSSLFNLLQTDVITPSGEKQTASWQAFERLSVADFTLEQNGTYRISLNQPSVPMTTFKKADGNPGRVFGPSPKLPEGATNVVYRTTESRVETFVTFNNANNKALKPTGNGLELGAITHPNDLFVGEAAEFQFFYNGSPITQSIEVHFVKDGTRHRNKRNEIKIKTAANGKFSVLFSEAGFYLLEADLTTQGSPKSGIDYHHSGLYVTLEVFPE